MNNDEILNVLMKTISQINDTKSLSITYAKELFYLSLKRKNNNIDTIRYYQNIFCRIDKFFIDHNIEWLYRIVKEPSRIKRFYDGNIKFLFKLK